MKTPSIQLRGYTDKAFIDSIDIAAILSVSRPTAYEIIHSLPHVGGDNGCPLRVRREVFEEYLESCEKATSVMEKIAKDKFVTVEGSRFYIRQQKGRTMVLQLVNF